MICISGNENSYDNSQTCFTVSSKAQGWVGIGIGGRGMDGSDIYVGYKNSTSGYTITNLVGMGHDLRPSDLQNILSSPLIVSSTTIKDFAFSFCRSNYYGAQVYPDQNYVYAYSHRPPIGNIDSPLAPLEMHDYFGFFDADFTGFSDKVIDEEGVGLLHTTRSFTFKQVVIIHGVMMWFAWAVLPFIVVFVARYLKSSSWWLRIHALIAGLILLLTLIAFILIALYKNKHFNSFHTASGLLILIIVLGQIFLGLFINKMFDKDRFSIPNRDKVHWWVGRFLLVFGLVTIQTGFNEYSDEIKKISIWIVIGHYSMIIVAIAFLIFGETILGPKYHVQKKVQDKDMKQKIREILERKKKTDKEIQNIKYRNASAGLEREMADLGFDVETDSSSDSDEDQPKKISEPAPRPGQPDRGGRDDGPPNGYQPNSDIDISKRYSCPAPRPGPPERDSHSNPERFDSDEDISKRYSCPAPRPGSPDFDGRGPSYGGGPPHPPFHNHDAPHPPFHNHDAPHPPHHHHMDHDNDGDISKRYSCPAPRPGPPDFGRRGPPYGGGPPHPPFHNHGAPHPHHNHINHDTDEDFSKRYSCPAPRSGPPDFDRRGPPPGGPHHPSFQNQRMPPFQPLELNLPRRSPPFDGEGRDFHVNVAAEFDEKNFPLEEIHQVESVEKMNYSGYNRNFDEF